MSRRSTDYDSAVRAALQSRYPGETSWEADIRPLVRVRMTRVEVEAPSSHRRGRAGVVGRRISAIALAVVLALVGIAVGVAAAPPARDLFHRVTQALGLAPADRGYRIWMVWNEAPYSGKLDSAANRYLYLTIQNRGPRIGHMVVTFTFHGTIALGPHYTSIQAAGKRTYFSPERTPRHGADYAWSLGTVPHGGTVVFEAPLEYRQSPECKSIDVRVYAAGGRSSRWLPIAGNYFGSRPVNGLPPGINKPGYPKSCSG